MQDLAAANVTLGFPASNLSQNRLRHPAILAESGSLDYEVAERTLKISRPYPLLRMGADQPDGFVAFPWDSRATG